MIQANTLPGQRPHCGAPAEQLAYHCRYPLPQWSDGSGLPLSAAPENFLRPLRDGLCCLVNRTLVLRLAKHAEASAALRRELLLLPQLAKHVGVRIPQPVGDGVQADTGERFICYSDPK